MDNNNNIVTESSSVVCNWDAKISLEMIEKTWDEIHQQQKVENVASTTAKEEEASSISTVLDSSNNNNNNNGSDSNNDDSIIEAPGTVKQQEVEKESTDDEIKKQEEEEEEDNNLTISTTGSSSTSSDNHDDDESKTIIKEETDAYRIRTEKKEHDVVVSETNTHKDVESTTVPLSLDQPSNDKEADGKGDNFKATTSESSIALDNAPQNSQHGTSVVVTTTASSSATLTNETPITFSTNNNNKDTISKVMDHTCSIFPTAFKLAAATATTTTSIPAGVTTSKITATTPPNTSHKHPLITIHPAYIRSISGEDLLCAFDVIMATAFTNNNKEQGEQCSFVPSDPISDSWIDLLRAYASTTDNQNSNDTTPQATMPSEVSSTTASESTSSSTVSIPLYMLIVFRFQLSLVDSYRNRPQPSNASASTTTTAEEAPANYLDYSNLLPSLITRVRELEGANPSQTNEVLSKLRSKFPETGTADQSDAKNRIEDYLLVPLKIVAERLMNTDEVEERPKVLQSIDSDIESSLPIEWYGDSKVTETIVELQTNGETVQSTPGAEASSEQQNNTTDSPVAPPTTGGKKKKKKNKKKVSSFNSTIFGNLMHPKFVLTPCSLTSDVYFQKKKGAVASSEPTAKNDAPVESTESKADDSTDQLQSEKEAATAAVAEAEEKEVGNVDNKTNASKDEVDDHIDSKQDVTAGPVNEEGKDSVTPSHVSEEDESKDDAEIPNDNEITTVSSEQGTPSEKKPVNNDAAEQQKTKQEDDIKETKAGAHAQSHSEDDTWETVESRPRGTRNKRGSNNSSGRSGSHHQNSNSGNASGGNSKKKKHRTSDSRNRTRTRKMVRDILNSVLDSVEEEVQRRRSLSREGSLSRANDAFTSGSNRNSSSAFAPKSAQTQISQKSSVPQKGTTMRDILVGAAKGGSRPVPVPPPSHGSPLATAMTYSERARSKAENSRTDLQASSKSKSEAKKPDKSDKAPAPADQNTIPTVPETLSAVSNTSAFSPLKKAAKTANKEKTRSIDSSSGESTEAQKPPNTRSDSTKEVSPSPPLPTLLSPGNNNSSSSSVASSLDAPHAGHHGNLSNPSENDVGYHLLDVCGRLSRDISVFTKRRDDALTVRRHERALVLSALEETLRTIWPGMCSVEMYGSCATNLDLPSSDLDVVVRGLDRPMEIVQSPSNATSSVASVSGGDNSVSGDDLNPEDELGRVNSQQEMSQYMQDQHFSQHQMSIHHMHMTYGHMSLNAERVVRLAMELEHQPWAVHVKAIPTATVPVIKILADPARLSGSTNGNNDWLLQHSMSPQQPTGNAAPHTIQENADGQNTNQPALSHYSNGQAPPLWRGADVVNGLLKVDITFEGPEHGGIGSTKFSSQTVEEFAIESGLPPESTPAVQVLMVLKELLAQRRLNEPFSGGLSSYALLLLVISVIRERAIIKEELEKAERQRRVVAAGGGNSALRSPRSELSVEDSSKKGKASASAKSQKKGKVPPPKPEDGRLQNPAKPTPSSDKKNETKGTSKNSNTTESNGKTQETKKKSENVAKGTKSNPAPAPPSGKSQKSSAQSSWASIARKSSSTLQQKESQENIQTNDAESTTDAKDSTNRKTLKKPSSFADAVAKGTTQQTASSATAPAQQAPRKDQQKSSSTKKSEGKKKQEAKKQESQKSKAAASSAPSAEKNDSLSAVPKNSAVVDPKNSSSNTEQGTVPGSVSSINPNRTSSSSLNIGPDSSLFPQGFHDVVEVLCSGETTPGKLLMHFLLFYGQHFDAQSTAIDYSGTHHRNANGNLGYSVRSPYMQRRTAGTYDPVTGMLTVDPIVVYDPLEGAETNNVARSCFAWSSIRWVFAQSYMTLSSAVEMNASQGGGNRAITHTSSEGPAYGHDESGNVMVDPSSPLLELLLSV